MKRNCGISCNSFFLRCEGYKVIYYRQLRYVIRTLSISIYLLNLWITPPYVRGVLTC